MADELHFLFDGPKKASWTIGLAHGAGAPMDTPFMDAFASSLGERGYRVARFEFPYMVQRRQTGKKKPPNRLPALIETWKEVIRQLGPRQLAIGGKSMGGRVASLVADESQVPALICLGYPFHPPGKPDQLRTEHLQSLRTPTLILQGTRDAFGTQEEVSRYPLSKMITLHWLQDGDHGFKPRKRSGRTESENWQEAIEAIDQFLTRLKN